MNTFWLIVIIIGALVLLGFAAWLFYELWTAPEGEEIPGVGFVAKKVQK